MAERGVIQHRNRRKQILSFETLLYGKNKTITPTDIDGVIEYENKAYIIFEVKHSDVEIPVGQKLCFERMVNDFNAAGKKSIFLVFKHEVENTETDVIVATDCLITGIYFQKKWYYDKNGQSAKDVIEKFILWVDGETQ